MTRKERMFAACRRQPVDRVPFATYNLHPCGTRHSQDPSYSELLAQVADSAGMLCKTWLTPRPLGAAAERVETRSEETESHRRVTSILHTPAGDLRSVSVTPAGQPSLTVEHFIKTDRDIKTFMSLPYEPLDFDPAPASTVDDQLAGRGVAYVGYKDPMHMAAVLFDFNDFAVRCLTDPGPIMQLIDFHFERIQTDLAAQLQAAQGRDFLFYTGGPEICTPPMMAPAMFARLVTPYQKRLIEMIHAAGFLSCIHCHGRVREVLPEILATGVDVLEPIEPPQQGNITLAELRRQAGGDLCLMGHIQDQEFHFAPPGLMTQRVEAIARVIDGGTGYVMTPTCTPFCHPAPDTFRRNYSEWLTAAARIL